MKKVILAIVVLVGGTALFLGATLAILAAQGRLKGDSLVSLSKRKAAKILVWQEMMKTVHEGQVVTGTVTRKIKGGLLVDIGVNVFLPADVHKRDLHQIHFQAWKKGVKSLYYCRSLSIQRAEKAEAPAAEAGDVVQLVPLKRLEDLPQERKVAARAHIAPVDYDECLACQ